VIEFETVCTSPLETDGYVEHIALAHALLNGSAIASVSEVRSGVSQVEIVVEGEQTATANTGTLTRADKIEIAKRDAKPFAVDAKRPFAHPFYWAPFVLIGNWR
jgi:CHAT domain-containing protein